MSRWLFQLSYGPKRISSEFWIPRSRRCGVSFKMSIERGFVKTKTSPGHSSLFSNFPLSGRLVKISED
jgi:hypothetical protein